MVIAQPIENPDLIQCIRHNAAIEFFSLEKEANVEDQLLCVECMREKTKTPVSLLWNEVKKNIQVKQQQKIEKLEIHYKQIIEQLDKFQCIINLIKKQLISNLDQLSLTALLWIQDLQQQLEQESKYSIFEDLKNMILKTNEGNQNSIEEKIALNYSQMWLKTYIGTEITMVQQLQEVIKQIFIQTEKDFFNNRQETDIYMDEQANQSISQESKLSRCLCLKDNKQISMINIDLYIQKEQRTLCNNCPPQTTMIPVEIFEARWKKYLSLLRMKRQKKQKNLELIVEEMKQSISQVKESFLKDINLITLFPNKQVKHGILFEKTQQIKMNQPMTLKLLQNMAEELSLCEESQDSKDDFQFDSEILQLNKEFLAKLHEFFQTVKEKMQQMIDKCEDVIVKLGYRQITCQQITEIKQKENCCAIAFNQFNNIMAAGFDSQIKIWELENGKLKSTPIMLSGHTSDICCLKFSKITNFLISGSHDGTIGLWKEVNKNNWAISQFQKFHSQSITCILLDKKEEQLISCSGDNTLKVWKVNSKDNEFCYDYSLDKHSSTVYSISYNESETIIASCGLDKLIIIWGKGVSQEWEFKYNISKSVDDYRFRLQFISDSILIWQQYSKGKIHVFVSKSGVFTEVPESIISLNPVTHDDYLFPQVINVKRKIIVSKQGQFVYIINYYIDGKFKVLQQPIDCGTQNSFGGMTNDAQFLVIWNSKKKNFKIFRINYE